MKILHIVNGNDVGGATTQVSMLIEAQKQSNDLKVLVLGKGKIIEFLIEKKVEYVLYNWSIFNLLPIILYVLRMKKEGYIIHSHGLKPLIIQTFILNFNNNKNLITTIHSDYKKEYKNKKIVKKIALPIFRYVCTKIEKVIVVSKEFKKTLIEDGVLEKNICFIPNGINIYDKKQCIKKEEFLNRFKLDFNDDVFICGTVARIHKVKGIDVLIETAKLLKEYNIIFLIAGSGDENLKQEYLSKIEEYNLNNIYFLGYINDINNFYNSIDINLIPSYSEALSYSLLEGALYEKSVICTKLESFIDVIENYKDGIIIEIGNYKQLQDEILKLYNDRKYCEIISKNLNKKILNNYNSNIMSDNYINVYKLLMK